MNEKRKARKLSKILIVIFSALLVIVAGALIFFTASSYYPDDVEPLTVTSNGTAVVKIGDSIKLTSFNIGYAGLGADEDFFMDGGKMVNPSKDVIESNLEGINGYLSSCDADYILLQEVDKNSNRSSYINELESISSTLGYGYSYAMNFKSFVPYPLPMIGKVNSGIATFTDYQVTSAERISLPLTTAWPVNTVYLKRCLLVERFDIGDSDKELVIINLHLEAYDDGEGRRKQTQQLCSILKEEYEKGNYVIAAGDFNQSFNDIDTSALEESGWIPGILTDDMLPDGFSYAYDSSTPSCRLLDKVYRGNEDSSYFYFIDGYIISDNVILESVETIDLDFEHSDHNPVEITITLSE